MRAAGRAKRPIDGIGRGRRDTVADLTNPDAGSIGGVSVVFPGPFERAGLASVGAALAASA
jgi:hypothetical protein